jgi:hypothetical protein
MKKVKPVEFLFRISHVFDIQKEKRAISESNKRKRIDLNQVPVKKRKEKFNADEKKPCSSKSVRNRNRFFG